MKKLVSILMMAILCSSMIACGNDDANTDNVVENTSAQESQIDEATSVESSDEESDKMDLSQNYPFGGYNFYLPEGTELEKSIDYGDCFQVGSNFVYRGDPAVAGIWLTGTTLEDAPEVVEEYVYSAIEHWMYQFDHGQTEQVIETSEIKTINDIEMLRVTGNFLNNEKSTEVEYAAYYLLYEGTPVYMIGFAMDENATIEEFVDSIAEKITK